MFKILLSLSVFMGVGLPAIAQTFGVANIDTSRFPEVALTLANAPRNTQAANIRLTENGQPVQGISIQAAGGGNAAVAVFFLIEASGHTFGAPVANMKRGLAEVLGTADLWPQGSVVNVGYFGRANPSGEALNRLSVDFSDDPAAFSSQVQSRIHAPRDTLYRSEVFKSIYESLEYMAGRPNLQGRKILIVLSTAINNSYSAIKADDCVRKAKDSGIEVYSVAYQTGNRYAADQLMLISEQTGGKFAKAANQPEVEAALKSHIKANAGQASGNELVVQYKSAQAAGTQNVKVQVTVGNQAAETTYNAPRGQAAAATDGDFLDMYGMYLIIGTVVLALGVVLTLFVLQANKKKRAAAAAAAAEAAEREAGRQAEAARLAHENQRLQDEARRQQEAAAWAANLPPEKLNLKRTSISSSAGGGTPQLVVNATGFSKSFLLTKTIMTLGRAEDNDIQIPDTTVSGHHGRIVNEGGNLFIEDLASTNGTLVNGVRVQRHALRVGDVLLLGSASAKLA